MLEQTHSALPHGWLAFELSVLARLDFASVILPFASEPYLGSQLKRRGMRVLSNVPTEAARLRSAAEIQNNGERLTDADLAALLEDVYVPGFRLKNPALRRWFGETDAWWFDNLRANAERLASPVKQAIALSTGIKVGDYALSFTDETLELRQPLSAVFRRLLSADAEPFDNGRENLCSHRPDRDFIAENFADLMFLRLPRAQSNGFSAARAAEAWREEWLRGSADSPENAKTPANWLGASVQTKTQYVQLVEEALKTALHIPVWAIAHVEDNFLTAAELAEIINRVRRVETIFTKDFTELTGAKAVIITA